MISGKLFAFLLFCLALGGLALLEGFHKSNRSEKADHRGSPIVANSASDRKLQAKISNEAIKLSTTLANNLAVGLFIGGLVGPVAAGKDIDALWFSSLILVGAGLHLTARALLRLLVSEE